MEKRVAPGAGGLFAAGDEAFLAWDTPRPAGSSDPPSEARPASRAEIQAPGLTHRPGLTCPARPLLLDPHARGSHGSFPDATPPACLAVSSVTRAPPAASTASRHSSAPWVGGDQ